MAANAANVLVGTTGAVYSAVLGSTAPTGATVAWAAAWKELGYIGEDGITENPGLDNEEIKAWQSGAVIRKVITGSTLDFSFECIETNQTVLGLFYPGSVITQVVGPPAETKLDQKLPVPAFVAIGLDVIDGTVLERIIIPRAQLSAREERTYANAAARGYNVTLSASPDSNNTLAIRYYNPQLATVP
jgi:hypothetical protein